MNEITDRTPSVIATEINSIKDQTRKMVLFNSIEIGRRLVEAKDMIEHGQWGTWLKESVDYSQSTANNLMRIFEEYGSDQIALFGDNAKSQAFGNLSYTQAVALLGIPQDEREAFIEENDIENMSTRELQQAIKERDKALEEKADAEERIKQVKLKAQQVYDEKDQLQKEVAELNEKLSKAQASGNTEQITKLECEVAAADVALKSAENRIVELEKKLKEKPIDVPATVEKVPNDVQKELDNLRKIAAKAEKNESVIKFQVCFDDLVKGFSKLLGALAAIKETEADKHEKYKNAVTGLIGKMQERL